MDKYTAGKKLKNRNLSGRVQAAITGIILVGILVLLNIIAGKLPWAYDMTAEKIYTLSDQTRKVLGQLNRPITIIAFSQAGAEDPTVKSLLEEYCKAGHGKITLRYIDAEENPAAAQKYDLKNEGIANGSIVFMCGRQIRKINAWEMYTPNDYGRSFSGEQLFTGAIVYLTTPKFLKVRFLLGHREMDPGADLVKLKGRLESEAAIVENINLLQSGSVPRDTDILAIASPKRDLNLSELACIRYYLDRGGRALLMFDVLSPGSMLPNFNNLLKGYGIAIHNNFVAEENRESFYGSRKNYLVPDYTGHRIVGKLKSENLPVLLPFAGNLDILQDGDPAVSVEPLLQSTNQSWIRYQVGDTTAGKTTADQPGPANLAVAITKDNSELKYPATKIIVIYNARFAVDNMLDVQGNCDFIMNAFNWVQDKEDSIAIRPKMTGASLMFVKGTQSLILMAVSVLIIPLIVFLSGLWVWLRRRHL